MRRITLNAAPVASLFLILAVFVVAGRKPSKGFPVVFATLENDCGDGLTVVAHLFRNGGVRFNSEDVVYGSRVKKRLNEIFRTRAEPLLFMSADPEVSFGPVLKFIDIAHDDVNWSALMTPFVAKQEAEHADWLCLKPSIRPALSEVLKAR